MAQETVLDSVHRGMVYAEPFPHIVVPNALPKVFADALLKNYPTDEVLTRGKPLGNNKRFSFPAVNIADSSEVPPLWKSFIETHVSQSFWLKVHALFAPYIDKKYPNIGALERTGVRNKNDFSKADVLLDAQICINSPTIRKASSVRGPHVDNSDKLFAGLYYLRSSEDDSEGGDLLIYRLKNKEQPEFYNKQFIADHLLKKVIKVPYEHNTLVLFLNSPHAFHGVSARNPTVHTRKFVNLIGVVAENLFDPNDYTERAQTFIRRHIKNIFL